MDWKGDMPRRWWGAAFLLTALAMLLAGETVLRERLRPAAFLVFWLICFLFTCLALFIAFLDVSAIRRRTREEQRALFENTLRDIARQKDAKAPEDQRQDENRG